MIEMRVTMLEAIRYWKADEDAVLDDLLIRLADSAPQNRKMKAGHALAKFFERADSIDDPQSTGDIDSVESEGWTFNFDAFVKLALAPVREMEFFEVFPTPYGPVKLTGHCDQLDGLTVCDQKLVENFEVEGKYTDSLQWRAYLAMLGAKRFRYDVFVGKVPDDEDVVTITGYHAVHFYTYPGIRDDVHRAVVEAAEVFTRYADRIAKLKEGAKTDGKE